MQDSHQPVTNRPTDLLDLSVVIVNYNVRELLEQALESVARASGGLQVETIVVDNDSADGSAEMVRARFPECALIANTSNVGFGAANNQAIRIARGRCILLLNPDTIVQEDSFRTLVSFLDTHPRCGAVGCKILNPDGSFAPESRRAFPTPWVALSRILGLSKLFPNSPLFGRYNLTYLPIDEATEVDALSGSCMMIRRAALVGTQEETPGDDQLQTPAPPSLLFDEEFFMYGEDLDLCYRIQLAGWTLNYTPDTQIIHYKGESTKKGDLKYVRLFYGAMLRFTEKHLDGQYSLLYRSAIRVGILVRGALSALSKLAKRLAPALTDFAIVYGVVAIASRFRLGEVPPEVLTTIAPSYAGATIAALAAMGAYRRTRLRRLLLIAYGVLAGLLFVATLSFFAKSIAYSRVVVLVSAPLSLLLMGVWRLLAVQEKRGLQNAVFVGETGPANRVAAQLRRHPRPPFRIVGYISPLQDADGGVAVPNLGTTRQIRDIVRLSEAETVVFATGSNTRQDIFGWMQELRGLPVTFRMLDANESFVISKSSIDHLSLAEFPEAEVALGIKRSAWSHRTFDIMVAIVGLAISPLVFLGAALGSRRMKHIAGVVGKLPSVLRGRIAVIGFDAECTYRPPANWNLRPGIVPVVTEADIPQDTSEIDHTYGYYAMNQSASADWAILRRSLRRAGS